jgi:HK97 family phage prohead protease
MKEKIERRYLPAAEIRVVKKDNEVTKIIGHPTVFDSLSEDLGGWKEIVRPGAFSKVLKSNPDVRALVDHMSEKIIGRTRAGTLILEEDDQGLYCEIDPANTTAGRDIVESLRRGDVSGMSIQFIVDTFNWIQMDGWDVREIIMFGNLYDVSVVTFPAFPETTAELAEIRSLTDIYKEHKQTQEQTELDQRAQEEETNRLAKEKRDRDIDIFEKSV